MNMRKFLPLAAFVSSLLLVGAGCPLLGGNSSVQLKPVTLQYWRIQDDPSALDAPIAAYEKLHPNVNVIVTTQREEDYDRTLLEAFALNKGPDIFSVPNTWLGEWTPKLLPMPKETTVATQQVNAQKQIVTVKQKQPTMSILDFTNRYVEGITKDLIISVTDKPGTAPTSHILGLPLSADTLALFYNRDILKRGSIDKPPVTWQDVQADAAKLTIFDTTPAPAAANVNAANVNAAPANVPAPDAPKVIKQSGAALGLGKNVMNNVDILSAIMWQNGAMMADDSGYANFANFTPATQGKQFPPGIEALIFYQSFAIPTSSNYSWNAQMPQSLDAFIAGKTAFYFGYPSDAAKIRDRSAKIDFGVAPLPQVDTSNPVNVLHYPVEVVSKKTLAPDEAWDFLQFITGPDQVGTFLTATKRPTALRGLIGSQLTDPDIAPFAGQVLTAKSWYKGTDYGKVEAAFNLMIETYPTFLAPEYQPIVAQAVSSVNETVLFR